MSNNITRFIIQVLNVPKNIQAVDFRFIQPLVDNFSIMNFGIERGAFTANLMVTTRIPVTLETLKEHILIESNVHVIKPEDIKVWCW